MTLPLTLSSVAAPAGATPLNRDILWQAQYDGPGNGTDNASALATSPDGATVFVTGASLGPATGLDFATVAYDAATGAQRWVARYDGPASGDDTAEDLAVSPDGASVFVTGWSQGRGTGFDFAIVAYDAASGTQRWARRYNATRGGDFAYALAVSPDGATVFATGSSFAASTGLDYATVAIDAVTGNHRWVARYSEPGNLSDAAFALAVSPDGSSLFVTGQSAGSTTGLDYATVAYDTTTGVQQWVSRYDGPGSGDDTAADLAVTPDGSTVVVTGSSNDTQNEPDYATVAYDTATGAERWVARYNGPSDESDSATALAIGPDGSSVFVTGYSKHSGTAFDYATVAYGMATGNERWVSRYDGPGTYDYAYDLAVSPGGAAVYVTGQSLTPDGSAFNITTLTYDAAVGHQRAIATVGPAWPVAIALTSSGSALFVTGSTTTETSGDDFETVAYGLSGR